MKKQEFQNNTEKIMVGLTAESMKVNKEKGQTFFCIFLMIQVPPTFQVNSYLIIQIIHLFI